MRDFYGAGHHATSSGGILIYSGTQPATTSMVVRVSLPDEAGLLLPPTTILTTAGIVAMGSVRLADGEWMTIWTEISAADRFDPFPSSEIRYSVSMNAGTQWGTNSFLSARAGVASALFPVTSKDTTWLFFMETDEGPGAARYDVYVSEWMGGGMDGPAHYFTTDAIQGV